MNAEDLKTAYEGLLSLNARLFEGGEFEAGYHSLCAATHCAQSLKEEELLGDLDRLAEKQGQAIDVRFPDHRLSSASAGRRGNTALFASLRRNIDNVRHLLHAEQVANEHVGEHTGTAAPAR